ncbi:aspartate kinase [Terrisporobacter sp.]|uniref:aspartate kinase n=1 Tax=Terrisporobacter sp. TaxID=1965305 RepID=UPI002603809F|nr:aspartate kinase [Terrisporobacter sp.]
MTAIVQKYGGSSLASVEKIKSVAKRVINEKEKGNDVVVVVSAMGKTTDYLVNLSKEISHNTNKRDMDVLLSTGEQISIALLSMAINDLGYDAISFTGFQAGIKTDGVHTKNKIVDIEIEKIKEYLKEGKIVVVAGFQGINNKGDITTLGRGGSDTTAVAIAAKLGCECNIYTDVDGIYSVDPRVYFRAKKLKNISYQEMIAMSSLGAGVMETRAVEIGYKYNVPIYVASSSEYITGTYIKEYEKEMEEQVIKGIAIDDNIYMITIGKVLLNSNNIARIIERLGEENVNIDMISQSSPQNGYVNLSFTVCKDDLNSVCKVIDEIKLEIEEMIIDIKSNLSKVSVVGLGMMNQSDMIGKMFRVLSNNNIEFKQFTTSEISVSYTLDDKDKEVAVAALAREFNL